ncbi:PAS domain S-box protein [Anabaena sp. WFMT]|uniref:PAS domain S-box protein n=1 Tax=Anabaena sp. WFMT TaxID=3449730 RepID=UPI003F258F76
MKSAMNARIYQRFSPYIGAISSLAIAMLAVCTALFMTWQLKSVLTNAIASFFFVAVAVSTWYGGLRLGLKTTILSVLTINYFFIPPIYSFTPATWNDFILLGLFFANSSIISLLSYDLQRSKKKLEQVNQQLLGESRQRYASLAAAVPVGIFRTDTVGNCLYVNEQWCKITGMTFDQALGTGWVQALHPNDRDRIIQIWSQTTQNQEKSIAAEFRFLRPDGVVTWVFTQAVVEQTNNGEVISYIGTVTDISESKQREEQLRLLESVIVTSNDAILITAAEPIDLPGPQIVYVNPAFTQMTGYTSAEILGKTPRILQGKKTEQAALDKIRANLQTWQPVQVEMINYRKDGSEFWVELNIIPVKDERGWFTHWIAIQRDITDRKQAETTLKLANVKLESRVALRTIELSQANAQLQLELKERQRAEVALRQSEAKFRSLSEFSPMGIFMNDAQGQCIYTNPRAQEIAGYTFAEALGFGWLEFVHPQDRKQITPQWIQAFSEQQGTVYEELRYVHKDGTIRYARVQSAPIFAENNKFIANVGTMEDITASRAIAQMKNEFISIVSHELRTPLTAIRGSLGLLAAGVYDKKPEKGKRMLQIASEQTDRLVRLVNDILDLGRLESGKMTLVMQSCDAATLIRKSVDTMQSSAEQNQITLSVNSPSIQIWANPDAIIQTLTNLLSNAIKFSPPHTTIWVNVECCEDIDNCSGSSSPHSLVRFQVKDQGRGIPLDKIEAIFDRFQQVDASDSREKGGTGLGLAICRRIIQQHDGNIWAESTMGEGSSFYFTLKRTGNSE